MIKIVSRAALCGLFLVARPAFAQDAPHQEIAIHGQATFVAQGVGGFASPYVGDNSLTPRQLKETADVTAFIGARTWKGGELWVNPEIDQGFGLSNTLGVAGFPSAEAYKVGKSEPYFRLQRAFFRQTIGLGGASETVAGVANQLGGSRSVDRIVLTIGKFGVGDVFDTNAYAHDPRGDFLNWSAVDTGSFDYAADAWAIPPALRVNSIAAPGRFVPGCSTCRPFPMASGWNMASASIRSMPRSSIAIRLPGGRDRCASGSSAIAASSAASTRRWPMPRRPAARSIRRSPGGG